MKFDLTIDQLNRLLKFTAALNSLLKEHGVGLAAEKLRLLVDGRAVPFVLGDTDDRTADVFLVVSL